MGLESTSHVPANHLVVDGEIIIPDSKGRSDHDALKEALGADGQSHRFVFYLFDLMHLDGFDLRAAPLIDRKRVLAKLIRDVGTPILYSDHLEEKGETMYEHACKIGLEGVISKRMNAPYRSGRSENWIKVKCVTRGTFIVVGYTPEVNGLVAALHLARKDGRELAYVGKVGTGWSMEESANLRSDCRPLRLRVHRWSSQVARRRSGCSRVSRPMSSIGISPPRACFDMLCGREGDPSRTESP